MPLEDLISRVREDTESEKRRIITEHEMLISEKESEKEEQILRKKKDLSLALEKEKDKIVSDYRKEKEFILRIKLLEEKRKLFAKALSGAKKEIFSLSPEEKRKIYVRRLKEAKTMIVGNVSVCVSPGMKDEAEKIIRESGISADVNEKDIGVKEGFFIEGVDFSMFLSLEDIVHEEVERNKGHLVNLLFK